MSGHSSSNDNGDAAWSMPSFARNFEACRHQQGGDVKFVAVAAGEPKPEVVWTRGVAMHETNNPSYVTNGAKYAVSFDPSSGEVALLIREIGPGDEGVYCCTASNAYGSVTARLQVRPEFKSNTLPRMSDARLTLQKQEAKGRATQAAENNPVTGL